jgi:hypothetical protein
MSSLEDELEAQIKGAALPPPVRQCRTPWDGTGRKFRADFAWPDRKIVLEVDGGTWSGGRHTSGAGYERDADKSNLAQLNGWRVLRVTNKHIKDGRALQLIEAVLSEDRTESLIEALRERGWIVTFRLIPKEESCDTD